MLSAMVNGYNGVEKYKDNTQAYKTSLSFSIKLMHGYQQVFLGFLQTPKVKN